jgi:pimeloyl-ACP methyl ester carboxylesterase
MITSALPAVPDAVLDDLRVRLRRFRAVPTAVARGWERGVDPEYLTVLLQHWADAYDWRSHEERIRSLPWVEVTAAAGPLRVIHRPGPRGAPVVLLLHGWTDSRGDVESMFSRDELLTWISAYWVTGSIGTSFTPYAEGGAKPWPRIEAPTAFTVFPRDLVNAPREFAERFFNVRSWNELSAGGHFAAWEYPADYARGVRSAVALAGL